MRGLSYIVEQLQRRSLLEDALLEGWEASYTPVNLSYVEPIIVKSIDEGKPGNSINDLVEANLAALCLVEKLAREAGVTIERIPHNVGPLHNNSSKWVEGSLSGKRMLRLVPISYMRILDHYGLELPAKIHSQLTR